MDELVAALRGAGCVFAEEEAELLLAEAMSAADLDRMVGERVAGKPLEQVIGWAEYGGLRVVVAPRVFVPRRRTELLARSASSHTRAGSVVVDLCCGTGAVAAWVLGAHPAAEVYAADLDPAAVACARRNLPPDRVFHGDLFAALPQRLRGRVDVLACNAPYVPTDEIALMPPEARGHEPPVALDGGSDGLAVQRRVVAGARSWLAPGGVLLIESSRVQAEALSAAFAEVGFAPSVVHDSGIGATVVAGRAPVRG